jgi:hypothetical protein
MKKYLGLSLILILSACLMVLPAAAQTTTSTPAAVCNLSAMSNSTTANVQLVAAPASNTKIAIVNGVSTSISAGQKVHICTVDIVVKQTTTAADFGLVYGTGSVCATGLTNLTPQWVGTISVVDKMQLKFGADAALIAPAGKAVCLKLSNTPTNAQVLITYNIS